MCLAVSWSSVCPELRGAGWPPALGDAGSPRTLTALNLLLLFMALCCFSVPQLSSVSFQPRHGHLCSRPFSSRALLGGPLSLPSARASLQQLASQYQSLRQGRRVLACPPSERARPAWLAEGSRSPCPSSLSSLIPSLQTVLRMHCRAGSSCLCGREKLLFGSWAQRGRTSPSPTAPSKELCVLVLLLFCLS